MNALLIAIGFLTRLPVPARAFDDTAARAGSLAWYPAVGLLLGGLLAGLGWVLQALQVLPPLLSAALLLLAWIVLTGGLHLDGLADSADAWAGGLGDRERTLAIMKDPRCGPAGVVAIVSLLLLKFAALASLSPSAWYLLALPPLLARSALTAAFISTAYVRLGGLGSALVDAPRLPCIVAVLLAALLAPVLFGATGVLALSATALVLLAWRRACMRRIGGITGDTAGALTERVEAVVLVAIVVSS